MTRCVIVGSAPFNDAQKLKTYIRDDDYLIAADGGQRLLDAMGLTPHAVIGDFDSSCCPAHHPNCRVLPSRKDDTDVLAAMRTALEDGYREFILLGCLGGRFDHTMANVFLLRFLSQHEAHGVLVDERHEVSLLESGEYTVAPRDGYYLSLLPYGGMAEGVIIRDAAYCVENATFDTVFPVGVSNAFIGKPVQISLKHGCLLMILAKDS